MHFSGLPSPSFGARAVIIGVVFVGSLCPLASTAKAQAGTEPSAREEPTDFGAEYSLLAAPVRGAMCCTLAPNESWVATGYGRWPHLGQVCVWDVATGKLRWRANEERGVRTVVASPDGALVASGNYGGHIRVRDAATGEIKGEFRESAGSIERLAFSPDGLRLASCSNSRVIRLWEVKTGKPLRALTGHAGRVNWVDFSHDGKQLLSAAVDKTVRLWNAQDGRLQQIFNHPEEVSTAIFLPGQNQIATACSDGVIRVFSTTNGQTVTSMAGSALLPPAISYAVTASGDGKLLASNCGSSIHVWDAGTGRLQQTFGGHADVVFGLSISRNGKTLVSASADSAVRIWSIPDEQSRHLLN